MTRKENITKTILFKQVYNRNALPNWVIEQDLPHR